VTFEIQAANFATKMNLKQVAFCFKVLENIAQLSLFFGSEKKASICVKK